VELVRKIKALGVVDDLSVTTNGSLLARYATELKKAGINRVNISLDTIDPSRFQELTCGGDVRDVLAGIQAAIAAGLDPVKLNVVLTEAVNEDDLLYFQGLVHEKPVAVRFIEYMPSNRCRVRSGMTVTTVTEHLKRLADGKLAPPGQTPFGCGPAHYLQGESDQGVYGFIAPISEGYCDKCNRIRLTADGRLRPCLLSDAEFDLRAILRSNATDEDIAELFGQAVRSKPSSHHLKDENGQAFQVRGMSQIGG
jgi:cyclic pyranopterin phosphate synthase